MNRQEFDNFVASFNKTPGTYTTGELIKIGLAHKELDRKDKNWQDLVTKVGWRGTKDSYRMFVNDHANDYLYEATEYDKIYISKTQVRDRFNALRRSLRDTARIEDFKEGLRDMMNVLPSLPKVVVKFDKAVKDGTNEAVLNFSDLHIGPDFENSYNKYNYNIAVERCSKVVEETIKYCKAFNVKRLNFLNLGDCISGIIHETLRYEQQMDVVEQTMKAAELICDMLFHLQNAAPEVIYRSVVDNHSRIMPDKNKNIEKENLNKIIDWFVEERLKNSNIIFVHDNIDDGIGKFDLMNGKKVMFAHGHQDSPDKSFQNFFGATREFIDYIFLAHYHNSKEKTFNGMKVFVNGSVIGCDPYAYGKRLFGEPEQKLVIFNDTNTVDIDINLK